MPGSAAFSVSTLPGTAQVSSGASIRADVLSALAMAGQVVCAGNAGGGCRLL